MSIDRPAPAGKSNRSENGRAPHRNGDGKPPPPPPHNIEAERGVIASVLLDPSLLPQVRSIVAPTDFFRADHETIFRAILALADGGVAIDGITLSDELTRRGQLKRIGGDLALSEILASVPHAANGAYYAGIVLEKSRRRDAIAAAERMLEESYGDRLTADEVLTGSANRVAEVLARRPAGVPVPAPFSLDLVDSEAFFSESYAVEWFVKGVLVAGECACIGGPSKSLKTSILIDLAISLATASRFLDKFEVPRSVRVGLISGESGRRIIQCNAREVCRARGIPLSDLSKVHWGFKLPQLSNVQHLAVLRKTIEDRGLECIAIDPFYLTLMAGNAGVDPSNMFSMGPILNDVASACLEAKCTPIIAHHFTKKRDDPFGPPELTDLAYAGIGQFIRQWMLVAPRERFNAEIGLFKLHLYYGGSAGHAGEYAVDIEVGKIDADLDRRCWKVRVASPSEERATKAMERQAEQEKKEGEKRRAREAERDREECDAIAEAVAALRSEPGLRATVKRLRALVGWNADKTNRIVARMEKSGILRPCQVPVDMGGGRTKGFAGYELNLGSELVA